MSYDIWLTIDTGGPEPATVWDRFNYTSNCGPMWRAAGADLAEFHGRTAAQCATILRAGIATLEADPKRFRAMDPPNDWGSYDSLLPALRSLADAFEAHPLATVGVSR